MGLILAPTYSQAENTLKSLTKVLDEFNVEWTWNKTPAFAFSNLPSHNNILSAYINSQLKQVRLGSADQYDNLRGLNLSWCCFDEAAMADEAAYQTVAPCLRGQGRNYQYQQLLLSTPRGRNWLYNNFCAKEMSKVEVIRAGSQENFIEFPPDKIEFLKSTMSKKMYEQEVLGMIVEQNTNAVFYSFDAATHIVKEHEEDKNIWNKGIIWVSCDQNISPLISIVGVTETGNDKNKRMIHVLDECYIEDNGNVMDMAKMIATKIKAPPGRIEVYGDRSGKNRNLVGFSYYQNLFAELKKHGWYVVDKTNITNPPVYDSAEEVNRRFETKTLTVSQRCQHLIADMDNACYKENSLDIDKKAYDPHLADALRYIAYQQRPGSGVGEIKF